MCLCLLPSTEPKNKTTYLHFYGPENATCSLAKKLQMRYISQKSENTNIYMHILYKKPIKNITRWGKAQGQNNNNKLAIQQ